MVLFKILLKTDACTPYWWFPGERAHNEDMVHKSYWTILVPYCEVKTHISMQSRKKVMFTIKSLKSLSPQKARRLLISRSSWKKQKTDVLKLKWTEEAVIGRSCRTKSVWSMPVGPRFLRSLDLEQKLEQRIDLGIDLKLPSWKTYTTKQISKVQFFSVKF